MKRIGPGLVARWRRLTLWPRLAVGVTVGFLVLFAGFGLLGIHAVDASTDRILHERLAITQELADDFDTLVDNRFADLRAFDGRAASAALERRLLAEVYHASAGNFTTLSLLDRRGRTVGSLGPGARAAWGSRSCATCSTARRSTTRSASVATASRRGSSPPSCPGWSPTA